MLVVNCFLGSFCQSFVLKLIRGTFETTYRAWMIACFREMHGMTRHFDADFDEVVDFLEDTHRLRLDRPIMFPGFIGGHCLIPNTELLLNVYDSEFLRLILESNEKRKRDQGSKHFWRSWESQKTGWSASRRVDEKTEKPVMKRYDCPDFVVNFEASKKPFM